MAAISYLVYITAIAGGLFAVIRLRNAPRGFFWMGCYMLCCGLAQFGGRYMVIYYGRNDIWYNFFGPVYYLLLFLVFYHLRQDAAYRKVIAIVFGLWFLPFAIAYRAAFEGTFASEAIVVLNLAVVTACLVFFYNMLQHPDSHKPPSAQGDFLLVMAMFFYFLSSFMRWLAESAFSDPTRFLANSLGQLNAVLVLLFYIFVCIAFWVQWKGMRREASG